MEPRLLAPVAAAMALLAVAMPPADALLPPPMGTPCLSAFFFAGSCSFTCLAGEFVYAGVRAVPSATVTASCGGVTASCTGGPEACIGRSTSRSQGGAGTCRVVNPSGATGYFGCWTDRA